MPLLATYTFAGAASLADNTNCFAHGLPTTPDWALLTPITPAGSAAALSIPIALLTRTSSNVLFTNENGRGVNAEMVAQFVHSMCR